MNTQNNKLFQVYGQGIIGRCEVIEILVGNWKHIL